MKVNRRFTIVAVIIVLALLLPSTALANKQRWKANMSFANELHEVVGSSARGTAFLQATPGSGMDFSVQLRGLSGQVNAMHIHGPADTTQNAGVLITLCSGGTCPEVVDGVFSMQGTILNSQLAAAGITQAQFVDWLDTGMLYVNAHTSLNPAGEARGQLFPQ